MICANDSVTPTRGSPDSHLCALTLGTLTASSRQHLTLRRGPAAFLIGLKVTTQLKTKRGGLAGYFLQPANSSVRACSSFRQLSDAHSTNFLAQPQCAASCRRVNTVTFSPRSRKETVGGDGTDGDEIRNIHPSARDQNIPTAEPTNRETTQSAVGASPPCEYRSHAWPRVRIMTEGRVLEAKSRVFEKIKVRAPFHSGDARFRKEMVE